MHDWTLPAHLGALRELGFPVLVGASRKRFIAAALGEGDAARVPPTARDTASAAGSALAAAAGAVCVHVHDVRASLDAVRVAAAHGERLIPLGPTRGAPLHAVSVPQRASKECASRPSSTRDSLC